MLPCSESCVKCKTGNHKTTGGVVGLMMCSSCHLVRCPHQFQELFNPLGHRVRYLLSFQQALAPLKPSDRWASSESDLIIGLWELLQFLNDVLSAMDQFDDQIFQRIQLNI